METGMMKSVEGWAPPLQYHDPPGPETLTAALSYMMFFFGFGGKVLASVQKHICQF